MLKAKRLIVSFLLLSIILASLAGCSSDTGTSGGGPGYPTSAVEIVIPYGPGGDTDLNARTIAKYLTLEFGESFVVTNMPGASGSIAYDHVKNSNPDGTTVLFAHNAMLISNVAGVVEANYTDFEVGGIGVQATTQVWSTLADAEYNTTEKIIEKSKADPGSLTFATLFGNFTHLEFLTFQREAGIELKSLDSGAGAADHLSALLGGHVDIISTPYNVVSDYVETGEVVILGNVSAERDPLIPDVPTFKEQGVNLEFSKIYPFFFPKDTSEEIVTTFTNALEKITQDEEYISDMNAMYMVTEYYSPEESFEMITDAYEFINTFDEIKPN